MELHRRRTASTPTARRRAIAGALAALAALALLAGCAGTAEPGATPTSPPPGATAPSGSATAPSGSTAESPTPSTTAASPSVAADLTVTIDETGSGATRTLTLTCDPVGGDHPDAAGACTRLAEVGAAAFDAPPPDRMCTQQYGGPQVATVEGTVAGTRVSARITRTDGCEIGRWDALVPVLPEAGGR